MNEHKILSDAAERAEMKNILGAGSHISEAELQTKLTDLIFSSFGYPKKESNQ